MSTLTSPATTHSPLQRGNCARSARRSPVAPPRTLKPLPPAARYIHQRTSMMQNTATRPIRGHFWNLTLTYLCRDEQTT
eukprot:13599326-Alexandrium_andersonii.AAC.1